MSRSPKPDDVVVGKNATRQALRPGTLPPRRTAPFEIEPGFYEPAGLWLYGNVKLLDCRLSHVPEVTVATDEGDFPELERIAQDKVLDGKILVCGVHSPAHRQVAVVPLRWGAPRILVLSGGFKYHLGENFDQEPFRAARLWRYKWDPLTDLAVSRRAPDKLPTFGHHNPAVDRLIARLARRDPSLGSFHDPLALKPT